MTKTLRITLMALLLILPLQTAAVLAQAEPAPGREAPAAPAAERPPAGPHTEEQEEHNLLSLDPGSAVWSIVLFILILVVLRVAAWKPILEGLQGRENKIKGDLEKAEKSAKDAAASLESYRHQLAQANAEARKIIEQGRADAHKLAASLQEQAATEIESARKRAQAEIAGAREQAVADIYTYTATLATDVAGKILKREIQPGDEKKLIDDSLAALKQGGKNN